MSEKHRDLERAQSGPKPREPYRKPVLKKHGHMADVTQKSGVNFDNSQTWPTRK